MKKTRAEIRDLAVSLAKLTEVGFVDGRRGDPVAVLPVHRAEKVIRKWLESARA